MAMYRAASINWYITTHVNLVNFQNCIGLFWKFSIESFRILDYFLDFMAWYLISAIFSWNLDTHIALRVSRFHENMALIIYQAIKSKK